MEWLTHHYEDLDYTIIEVTKGSFRQSLATFARALDHEFFHVMLFANGYDDSIISKNVREVLAYHRQIFNKNLPSAPYDEMKGYHDSARTYFDKLTPKEIKLIQPVYNVYIYSKIFK